jgi:hypothetical protein
MKLGIQMRTLVGIAVAAGALVLGVVQSGVAGAATPAATGQCSLAAMKGTYIAYVTGFTVGGASPVPFAFAYVETYDGKGNDTGIYTYSSNGAVYRNISFSGTYTVNANCTGTETDTDTTGVTSHTDNYYAPDGRTSTYVATDVNTVESGSETRVTGGFGGN